MDNAYKWLTDFYATFKVRSPLSIEFIIPRVFERYFLIHENYGIIDEFPFDDYPANNAKIEDLNKRHELERYYEIFLRDSKDRESLYRPITLKELAARFHADYSVDMLENIKDTPGIWPLREKTSERIEHLINIVKKQDPLYLYVSDYYRFNLDHRINEDMQMKEKNELKDVSEYIDFQFRSNKDSCSYLFPYGHSWCLATFEDFPHFIFGCDSTTAEKLSLVNELEYFETTQDYKLP
jgi:hypothetical protein